MAMTNAQLEEASAVLVETIDEALKLVSDVLALHNMVLLQLATTTGVTPNAIERLQNLANAWEAMHKELES